MKKKIEIEKDMPLFLPHTAFLSNFLTSALSLSKHPVKGHLNPTVN